MKSPISAMSMPSEASHYPYAGGAQLPLPFPACSDPRDCGPMPPGCDPQSCSATQLQRICIDDKTIKLEFPAKLDESDKAIVRDWLEFMTRTFFSAKTNS